MTTAQYNLATGIIESTLSPGITNGAQIAALQAQGIGVISVPDGSTGSTGMIVNGAYIAYNAPATPIPSLIAQYIADQISQGNANVANYHQASIAQLNQSLTTAGLTAVTVAASTASTVQPPA